MVVSERMRGVWEVSAGEHKKWAQENTRSGEEKAKVALEEI